MKERDAALRLEAECTDELRHRLGVNQVVMANVALASGNLALAEERLNEVPLDQRGWEWRYLKHQTNGGIFTMYGHQLQVTDITFSSDGKWVLTGSERDNDETLEAKVCF